MREPTQQELLELENYFGTSNNVADVKIHLIEATEDGWTVNIYFTILAEAAMLHHAFLWLDQDEFHIITESE